MTQQEENILKVLGNLGIKHVVPDPKQEFYENKKKQQEDVKEKKSSLKIENPERSKLQKKRNFTLRPLCISKNSQKNGSCDDLQKLSLVVERPDPPEQGKE